MRLIDADVLKEYLGCDGDNKYSSMIMHEIADCIDEQPTIDAKPELHGHWIPICDKFGCGHGVKCSECKRVVKNSGENFCPKCGLKMDGGAQC
mgnify:CR=1 FL=1